MEDGEVTVDHVENLLGLSTGDGEESELAVGDDEQRHSGGGEVRGGEELPLSKRSKKEHKRKKLEEDIQPRETVKTNKRGGSQSATLLSLRIQSPASNVVRSPGVNLLMSTPRALARVAALKRWKYLSVDLPTSSQAKQMRSPSPETPCCTIHFPSLTMSPSPTRTSHDKIYFHVVFYLSENLIFAIVLAKFQEL